MGSVADVVDDLLVLLPPRLIQLVGCCADTVVPAVVEAAADHGLSEGGVIEIGRVAMLPFLFGMTWLPVPEKNGSIDELRTKLQTLLDGLDNTRASVVLIVLRSILLWTPPIPGQNPGRAAWLEGGPPPGWHHLGNDWDGMLVFAFGAGLADVGPDADAPVEVHSDLEAARAQARRLTPEPGTVPRTPLTARTADGTSKPSTYDVVSAARWRGGSNLGLAASVLRLIRKAGDGAVRGVACQWEIHDLLHGLAGNTDAEGLWAPAKVADDDGSGDDWIHSSVFGFQQDVWHGIYPSPEGYLNSMIVADDGLSHLLARGCSRILVVAHPEHSLRAVRSTAQAIQRRGVVGEWSVVGVDWVSMRHDWARWSCDDDGYWPSSAQPWTSNAHRFLGHEVYSRLHDLSFEEIGNRDQK